MDAARPEVLELSGLLSYTSTQPCGRSENLSVAESVDVRLSRNVLAFHDPQCKAQPYF